MGGDKVVEEESGSWEVEGEVFFGGNGDGVGMSIT